MCYDSYVMTHMTLTVTSVDSTEVEKLQKENQMLIKMNSMQPIQKLTGSLGQNYLFTTCE